METSVYSNVLALSLMLTMTAAASAADKATVPLTDPSRPATVKVSLISGGITVKAYDGREVVVEASSRDSERPSRAGSMKRVPMNLTGLTVEEENNVVDISAAAGSTSDVSILVPPRTSLHLSTVNDGNIVVTGVDGEIDVSDINGAVTLNHVSGTVVAHALNGAVKVVFDRVNSQKPMAFSSLNGDVDVTFPADLKATVSIAVEHGDVFSDFDLDLAASSAETVPTGKREGGKYRVNFEKSVHGTINGGGQPIQFKNFNGNVYIRKR